jgi:hypothetical protein
MLTPMLNSLNAQSCSTQELQAGDSVMQRTSQNALLVIVGHKRHVNHVLLVIEGKAG